jgi:hypothetical protein
LNAVDTHSLKPPGFFNPKPYEVKKNWFLKVLLFQISNLYRYSAAAVAKKEDKTGADDEAEDDEEEEEEEEEDKVPTSAAKRKTRRG